MNLTPMEMAAQFMIASMRETMDKTAPEDRAYTIELVLNAFARFGIEYLPAADVAKLLRQYAETLDGG